LDLVSMTVEDEDEDEDEDEGEGPAEAATPDGGAEAGERAS
jgi:hypothetical protein